MATETKTKEATEEAKAKNLNLSDEIMYRLRFYPDFSEYQLQSFYEMVYTPDMDILYKQSLFKLILLNTALLNISDEQVEKFFVDKVSGKNLDRPGFTAMMEYVREGDVLVICSMDRLARSLMDLLNVTRKLQNKGVTVRFLKEKIELSPSGETSAISKLLMAMMGAVAEFERSLIRERQQQGIALAKARGVYRGRKPVDNERLEEAKRRIAAGVPKTKVAKDLKIGRTTLYKYLKG